MTTPERRAVAALLLRAVRDAESKDPALAAPARRWLAEEAGDWAEALDIHPDRVTALLGDLPPLAQPLLL